MMQQRFDVTLNSVSMASLAREIIVRDIVEQPASMSVGTVPRGKRAGMRVSRHTRESLSVKIVYRIKSYDVTRRAEVRDLIAQWAVKGGRLRINTRPGKGLYVISDTPPALDSSLKWTQDLSLIFTAYEQPYWEDDTITSKQGSTTLLDDGSYWLANVLTPPGNVQYVPAMATISVSGPYALSRLKISCGATMFELTGMNIPAGNIVTIGYDSHDRLMINDFTNNSESLLQYRTAQSDDDLLFEAGALNNFSVQANTGLNVQIYTRGRWV
jgi:hypothetical protein